MSTPHQHEGPELRVQVMCLTTWPWTYWDLLKTMQPFNKHKDMPDPRQRWGRGSQGLVHAKRRGLALSCMRAPGKR